MVNTILFWFDLIRFRKYFSVCIRLYINIYTPMYRIIYMYIYLYINILCIYLYIYFSHKQLYVQRYVFEILLNQTKIRLYLPFFDWFVTADGHCPLAVPNQSTHTTVYIKWNGTKRRQFFRSNNITVLLGDFHNIFGNYLYVFNSTMTDMW